MPRAAVARGQALFKSRVFVMDDVSGITGDFFKGDAITGTCTVCHDTHTPVVTRCRLR
jgi:hypothetical protein